jgi:hypothetical protein
MAAVWSPTCFCCVLMGDVCDVVVVDGRWTQQAPEGTGRLVKDGRAGKYRNGKWKRQGWCCVLWAGGYDCVRLGV